MACLDARRDQARALVELLATADAHVVERAPAAVGELQDLTACTDARRLAEHPDPPADPAVRGRLAALTRDLARSAALQTAGNYRDAIALATSLVAPARATGYRPIEAEVLVQVGTLHGLMLDGKQAVPRLLDGLTAAQASGDVATTAQAATQLAYATATFDQHFDEAHRWLQLATGALERLDHPRDLEARLAMVHGAIALAEGDAATAQRQYQRAAELRRQLVGDADPSVAIALSGVGMGYERAGDEATARTYYRQALAILEPALGASHPRVADVLSNLGTAERELGHLDEAITLGQRAIAIREQVFGAASAEVAGALLDLAGTLQEARRFEDAVPVAARARAIFAATSNDADASLALTSEGLAALELGHLDDADARLREALAIQERTLGADHPDLMVVLGGLGALALARHDPHDAAARYARATAVVTKAFGPDTTRLIEPLDGQSEAARALGDSTAAIATATRAVTLAATQPDDAAAAAQTAFVLAQALRAGGQQPARARQLAGDALARYQALGPRWATARDEVARWLAASPSP
jgi:serine/threonine-protein kinase